MNLQVRSQQRNYGWQPPSKEWLAQSEKMERYLLRVRTTQTWQPGATLDQGSVGACVAFSGTHDLNATPNPHTFDNQYALDLYWYIKQYIDNDNHNDDGTTHESLVKRLIQLGYVGNYAITQDAQTAWDFVDSQSPVLLGTVWYFSMEIPDANGILTVNASSGIAGGHSYLWIANTTISGVKYAVIQNSWGTSWGVSFRGVTGGFAYIKFDDVNTLLTLAGDNAGDVLAFVEQIPTPVAVTGVSLDKTALSLTVGGSATLTPTITPSNATNQSVTWQSSDSSLATVSSTGVVKAVAVGIATITVTTADGGFMASCQVTITNKGCLPIVSSSLASIVTRL